MDQAKYSWLSEDDASQTHQPDIRSGARWGTVQQLERRFISNQIACCVRCVVRGTVFQFSLYTLPHVLSVPVGDRFDDRDDLGTNTTNRIRFIHWSNLIWKIILYYFRYLKCFIDLFFVPNDIYKVNRKAYNRKANKNTRRLARSIYYANSFNFTWFAISLR